MSNNSNIEYGSNNYKIKQYKKNELLGSIISDLFPKTIFQKILNLIRTEHITNSLKKNINIINKDKINKIKLTPYLSSNYNITDKMSIEINNKNIKSGSFGKVYKKIKRVNKYINNIIFKEISNTKEEFESLIFHFLLQEYYKRNNFKKLIHLCNLFEFGYFENNKETKLYAIMENCGLDLTSYKIDNNKKKYEILLEILKILYQCCKSLELIHERGYLHLDIKLENFMINNNIIKIIDFGFLKKNNSIIRDFLTEPAYTPNDLIVDSRKTKKFTYHHDIFSLGCMFIYIIYLHIFNEKKIFMICPLNYDINSKDDIFNKRKLYNIKDLNFMIDDINTNLKKFIGNNNNNNNKNNNIINLIIELIPKLVNPDPIKRYQSVKDIKNDLLKFQNFESNIKNNEEKEIKKIEIPKRINNN